MGELGGFDIGEPQSVVFGFNDLRQIMVVFTDIPQVCSLLYDSEPPPYQSYWVISTWTLGAWREDEGMSTYGYAAVSDYGQVFEFTDARGSLEIFELDDEDLSGRMELDVEGEMIETRFEAEWCDAYLFQGMEE